MKQLTQEELVMSYLEEECGGRWVFGYQLIGRETQRGFLDSSITRRCRELVKRGLLERRKNKRFTEFRIKIDLN